jgi:hypothetical protein
MTKAVRLADRRRGPAVAALARWANPEDVTSDGSSHLAQFIYPRQPPEPHAQDGV